MEVSILHMTEVDGLSKLWGGAGDVSHADFLDLENFFAGNNTQCYVAHRVDVPVAVFDVRDTPGNYFKNMRVKFHPTINFEKAESPDEVENMADTAAYVLGIIFEWLIGQIKENKTKVKIYNDHPMIRYFFVKFAKHLNAIDENYKIKIYGNWIEVIKD